MTRDRNPLSRFIIDLEPTYPSPSRTYYLGTGALKEPLRAYYLGTWGARVRSLLRTGPRSSNHQGSKYQYRTYADPIMRTPLEKSGTPNSRALKRIHRHNPRISFRKSRVGKLNMSTNLVVSTAGGDSQSAGSFSQSFQTSLGKECTLSCNIPILMQLESLYDSRPIPYLDDQLT